MRKLLMIIVLLLLVVIGGCSSEKESKKTSDLSDEITIYNAFTRPDDRTEEYLEYLKSDMGVNLNSTIWRWNTSPKELDGVLKIGLETYRNAYEDRHNVFLPLNDFLSSNYVASEIPEAIMNAVTDEDGNVWALLSSHRFNTRSRVYNEDMMEQLGQDTPQTAEEFKELLMFAKETYDCDIIRVTEDCCCEMFYDIFAYFKSGVINNSYTIGWNKASQSFIDHAITDEMYKSLQFIKDLNEADLIEVSFFGKQNIINVAYEAGNLFTTSLLNGNGLVDKYSSNCFVGSKINIEIEQEQIYLYTIPIGTADVEKKMGDFVNTFFENEKVNKAGSLGIEGKHYTYINPEFISIDISKGIYFPKLADYWLTNFYIYLPDDENPEDYDYWMNKHWPKIQEDYHEGVYWVVPISNSIDRAEGTENDRNIHNTFNRILFKFLEDDRSVDEFFEEYENEMARMGLSDYLESLNNPPL